MAPPYRRAKIILDEKELRWKYIHASGPGGQHVNKVATAVQLRFNLRTSRSLPEPVRARLERRVAGRLTEAGDLIIEARSHRSRERNRCEARQRLERLVAQAAVPPRLRRPTRPTRASRQRLRESKRRHSLLKKQRRAVQPGLE